MPTRDGDQHLKAITHAVASWLDDAEITADLASQVVIDFAMPWHSGGLVVRGIRVNTVLAAISEQIAPMRLNMADEIDPFHGETN